MKKINLQDCHEQNDVLYRDDRFWISVDVLLLIDFLKKIHEFSTFDHFEFNRMKNFLKRDYYWSKMRKTFCQYVRNCFECQRNKVVTNRKFDLLIFLIIFSRRWKNISMNFVAKLLWYEIDSIMHSTFVRLLISVFRMSVDSERLSQEN